MTITINRERILGILAAIILLGIPALLLAVEGMEQRAQKQQLTDSALSVVECVYGSSGDC